MNRCEVEITLTIFSNGTMLPPENPCLSYTASSLRQKESAHRSIMTRSGSLLPGTIGEYDPTQITSTLIERRSLELAETLFAGVWAGWRRV